MRIEEGSDGEVDLEDLSHKLQLNKTSGRKLIGCFSAVSNITGLLFNVDDITSTLHEFGALAFWDYAAGGK